MSAQVAPRNAALCDVCQKKPKSTPHNYCGRNCAAQAASLCDYCHQKPKFAGHSYCSKNCGSQAKNQGFGANTAVRTPAGRGAGAGKTYNGTKNGTGPKNGMQLPQAEQILNAVAQILPHVAPHGRAGQVAAVAAHLLPHVQAMLQPQVPQSPQTAYIQPVSMAAPKATARAQNTQAAPLANTTNFRTNQGSFQNQIHPAAAAECQIPGCQQPVHIDQNDGQMSDYCSMLHRQEAVQLGLADACIMCLKMPQGSDDHFCGKACRDEALSSPA
ncbi:hypothetical protein M0805_007675 [Coniferiporia weirii]|nr:hypothetical protein M0805_007675 [Coniferiporia weirii]